MTLLAAVLFATLPMPGVACDRVDLVEVNHVYDACGKHTFSQLIFYDRGNVRAWRLLKHCNHRPERDPRSGEWVTIFHDGPTLREVRAGCFRERWTQYDVELDERDRLSKERRVDFIKPFCE